MFNLIMVECKHDFKDGDISNCIACHGSGYVAVIPGEDGEPLECKHGKSKTIKKCYACHGSGWAGVVYISRLYTKS